jgi:hypothetical protein
MRRKIKVGEFPPGARTVLIELASFDFTTDVPPLDTLDFRKRVGEIIVQATNSSQRSKPPKPPERIA